MSVHKVAPCGRGRILVSDDHTRQIKVCRTLAEFREFCGKFGGPKRFVYDSRLTDKAVSDGLALQILRWIERQS